MTVRNLMAGYTAYTDAKELMAMRGTHRGVLVTTTYPTITTTTSLSAVTDFDGPDTATKAPILTIVRQVQESE
jgi:hypothetical protein